MISRISATVLLLLCASAVAGEVFYVDCNGPNDPGSGTIGDPFRKIQAGMDAADNDDVVVILPGIYSGNGNYDLNSNGKTITITGIDPNDPCAVAQTIIDPNRAGRAFYLYSDTSEDSNFIIKGLTITNAHTDGKGAGIYCQNYSAIVSNCVIRSNSAAWHGGGAFCRDSNIVFERCTIAGNSAEIYGGGVEIWGGQPTFKNCIFQNNDANHLDGGGVDCYDEAEVHIINCTLAANSTLKGRGGAVFCTASSVTLVNSIIRANTATTGPQIGLESETGRPGTVSLDFSNIAGGQEDIYDPCNLLGWGEGNIDSDPCFAFFDTNGDPNLWDFHLQSDAGRRDPDAYPDVDLTQNGFVDIFDFAEFAVFWGLQGKHLSADLDDDNEVDLLDFEILLNAYLTTQSPLVWVHDEYNSPCLDAGDPNSNWTREPWPNGKRINMGAYGGTRYASKTGNIADFNVDGKVNFIDFAQLATKWNEEITAIEDLDGDGIIDVADLGILSELWLWER